MILKEADDRSAELAQLERLCAAAVDGQKRSAIRRQMAKLESGMRGERDAALFLGREFGASEKTLIIHDLRFEVDGEFAQIDHLVLHWIQRSAWVLETKNHAGRLTSDEHGDWTVWRGRRPKSIASPLNQARRQCEWLRLWLERHSYKPLRKIEPVVLISPTSSMDRRHLGPAEHVVKSDNFRAWWDKQTYAIGFASALGIFGQHLASGMSRDEFLGLGEQLVAAHVKAGCDWSERFCVKGDAETPEVISAVPQTDDVSTSDEQWLPASVRTKFGMITFTRVSDGVVALRNEKNADLIDQVRSACRGKGRWQPRYKNWLLRDADVPPILSSLQADEGARSSTIS